MQKLAACLMSFLFIITCYAMEPPKIIKFKNNVTYDHEGHKGDCISCHDTADGGTKITGFGKEWAHKKCIGCHSAIGNGPTSCNDCHKKP